MVVLVNTLSELVTSFADRVTRLVSTLVRNTVLPTLSNTPNASVLPEVPRLLPVSPVDMDLGSTGRALNSSVFKLSDLNPAVTRLMVFLRKISIRSLDRLKESEVTLRKLPSVSSTTCLLEG